MAGTRVKLGAVFIFLWLLILIVLGSRSESDSSNSMETEMFHRKLRKAKEDVPNACLIERNSVLENAAKEARELAASRDGRIDEPGDGPSLEHETARYKLADNIQELWYAMRSQLKKLDPSIGGKILEDMGHRHRSIQVDLMKLSQVDNNEAWRDQEHRALQSLMQRRLHYLQNPKDCSTAKKLLCDLDKECGFGCQLHHAIYCFIVAYGTERTMILHSEGWRYSNQGWDSVFLPLSESCTEVGDNQKRVNWNEGSSAKDADVIILPIVRALRTRPEYMPLSFPEDLAPRLLKLHGNPSAWFVGQFAKYMMRLQPHLEKDLNSVKEKINFKNPIVGVHVRRTDKVGTEAAFHGIEEYMEHVEEWFLQQERLENKIDKRRVYIASDDASVLPDARKKYPNYEFLGDTSISESAGLGSRYTDNSLRGVIIDIYMLSLTDYIVCTFSSQVSKLAYEMMQTLHSDAARWFHSLDAIYSFRGQMEHEKIAIYKHSPENREEIAIEVGDIVSIAGNHWDGYSKGQNKRTGGIGLYPSYKTVDKKVIVKYPTYDQVPLAES